MPSNESLSDLLHNLDATTYFFVSSGLFIGAVGLVFFILGLWFGGMLWRGYKRRYRSAEATIESLKNEAAQLKRCIAGQNARVGTGTPPFGLPEPMTAPVEMEPVAESAAAASAPLFPFGQPFTLWTLAEEPAPQPKPAFLSPSRAFTVWTEPRAPKSVRIADLLSLGATGTPAPAPAPAPFTAPLLFPSPPPVHPASQAFSIWTEEDWAPTPIPALTPPPILSPSPSAAFSLWTAEDFTPPMVLHRAPAPVAPPALPQSREAMVAAAATAVRSIAGRAQPIESEVTVSFPEESFFSIPRSRAFTLWTLPTGSLTQGGISQRNALASLIRSRVEPPPLPSLPPLEMEPLPFIELSPQTQ